MPRTGMRVFDVQIEAAGKNFVADEHIVLVTKDRVRARQPAIAVQLVVIKTKLAHKLRFLRAAAFDAVADIQNDQSVSPVSEIGQTVLYLQVMQIATVNLFVALRSFTVLATLFSTCQRATSFGFFTSAKSITRIEPVASSVR